MRGHHQKIVFQEALTHLKAPKAYAAVASGTTGRACTLTSLCGLWKGLGACLLYICVLVNALADVADFAAGQVKLRLSMPSRAEPTPDS